MPRIITITLTVPDDVEVNVDTSPPSLGNGDAVLSVEVVDRIQKLGTKWATWEEAWARWAVEKHGARIVCSASIQKGRINAFRAPGAGASRFAGLMRRRDASHFRGFPTT